MKPLHPVLAELLVKAATTKGEGQREAARDALFLFPTLVLGPQKPGASSSYVKAEVAARLDLWNKGALDDLVARAHAF